MVNNKSNGKPVIYLRVDSALHSQLEERAYQARKSVNQYCIDQLNGEGVSAHVPLDHELKELAVSVGYVPSDIATLESMSPAQRDLVQFMLKRIKSLRNRPMLHPASVL